MNTAELVTPRKWMSSVVLNDDTLWVMGGRDLRNLYLKSTEFVRYTTVTQIYRCIQLLNTRKYLFDVSLRVDINRGCVTAERLRDT